MLELINYFFTSSDFIPHGHCYLWKPDLVWLHILSDALIALAYYSIPITLFHFVRQRRDLPFDWIFLLFGVFIIACGTTHLMEIWTPWHPTYWLSGAIKVVTATVSVFTALQLVPLVPQALALPSPAQLESANQQLQTQIAERLRVEQELRKYQDNLEELVAVRNHELIQTNAQLQQEIEERRRTEVALVQEITERKRLEQQREALLAGEQSARQQAEAANRVKDQFLAILSHELRTPLNPILGWVNLLQTRSFDSATTAKALTIIERNARLQIQLIDDLLDVSRILHHKLTLEISSVDLAAVIAAAVETMDWAASAKAIQIQIQCHANVSPVSGDFNRLLQVVGNLLSNAIKFTPSGGQVEVCLRQDSCCVQISVSDTGIGISPDVIPYIFEYFRQADSSTTRKFGGLGLGLAIARNLVELHGGTVAVESPGEGNGATFTVKLPLVPASLLLPSSSTKFPTLPNLAGVKVLIVEDEDDSREFLSLLLKEFGASVTEAASGLEALSNFALVQPNILLCDIGMPDMDGYNLIRLIRTIPPAQGGAIPAIALTAYAGETDKHYVLGAGFTKHVAKPVVADELIALIAELVKS